MENAKGRSGLFSQTLIQIKKERVSVIGMITTNEQKIRLGFLGSVTGHVDHLKAIELLIDNDINENIQPDLLNDNYRKYTVYDEFYLVVEKRNEIQVFKILPLVEIDKDFHWAEKRLGKGWRNLWCQIKRGFVNFNITYYLKDNRARVSVSSTIKGKYNVEIDSFFVHNATNEAIMKEIKEWLSDYKSKVNAIA